MPRAVPTHEDVLSQTPDLTEQPSHVPRQWGEVRTTVDVGDVDHEMAMRRQQVETLREDVAKFGQIAMVGTGTAVAGQRVFGAVVRGHVGRRRQDQIERTIDEARHMARFPLHDRGGRSCLGCCSAALGQKLDTHGLPPHGLRDLQCGPETDEGVEHPVSRSRQILKDRRDEPAREVDVLAGQRVPLGQGPVVLDEKMGTEAHVRIVCRPPPGISRIGISENRIGRDPSIQSSSAQLVNSTWLLNLHTLFWTYLTPFRLISDVQM